MRRRVLPLLLTAAAGVVALVRRSRRQQGPSAPRYVAQPSARVLAAPETPDDVVTDGTTADRALTPDAQVEAETSPPKPSRGENALHNAAARATDEEPTPVSIAGDDAEPPRAENADALRATAPAGPSPFRSVAWEPLDGDPAPDTTELRIGFSLVARYESLARIDVRETASQVFVTVLARFDPPAGGWFAYAEAHQATVPLEEPLGDRALVHAPAEEPGR
jgi:hypothetical protein